MEIIVAVLVVTSAVAKVLSNITTSLDERHDWTWFKSILDPNRPAWKYKNLCLVIADVGAYAAALVVLLELL